MRLWNPVTAAIAILAVTFCCAWSLAWTWADEAKPSVNPKAPAAGGDTQTVFAEGVGSTEEEALKDAFRAAVRQVVGEVVDGETLVKNEELVKDQVLTYSHGFIPEHKFTSEKRDDSGLFHIGIEAKVQRRSVIMKLRAANITLKSFDGESLYGRIVTQEEAKADATQLLRKALVDLPRMLTAEMVERTYDRKKGDVVLRVSIKPDRKAFDPFRERLEQVLKKVAMRRQSILMHSEIVHGGKRVSSSGQPPKADLALPTWFHEKNDAVKVSRGEISVDGEDYMTGTKKPIWPRLGNKERWCIALCSSNDASDTTTRWNIYTLDADPIKSLGVLFGQTRLALSLLDSAGGVVTEDEVGLGKLTWQNHMPMGFLRGAMGTNYTWCRRIAQSPTDVEQREGPERHWLLIAPYCLYSTPKLLVYAPECILERRIKLTLDDLKRITDVRCKVVFRPIATRQNGNRGNEMKASPL